MTTTMKARPTIYKGIQMRSRLEAGFAQWLDQWNFVWDYEPQAFANASGQYLPDFRVSGVRHANDNTLRNIYVETKPAPPADIPALCRRMAIVWDSEPEATLYVAWPNEDREFAAMGRVCIRPDEQYLIYTVWVRGVGTEEVVLAEPLPNRWGAWGGEWWKP